MQSSHRTDPTFPIFVVLAAIFIFSIMYATWPRLEAPTPAAASATAKK